MKERLKTLLQISIFWISIFIVNRLLFAFINLNSENTITLFELSKAMFYGLRLDVSLVGYIILFSSTIFALTTYTTYSLRVLKILNYILIPIIGGILFTDLVIFSFWNSHFDSSALIYADRMDIVTMSLKNWQFILLLILIVSYIGLIYFAFNITVNKRTKITNTQKLWYIPIWLFIAAAMIIPMRGGLQHIPLNTGAAYFSKNSFANLVAVNPVWNFSYSMKRFNKLSQSYNYMPKEQANGVYKSLYATTDSTQKVLKSENPNVVIIIMESFNAAVIDTFIDNNEVTPSFNALKKEGIFFSNIYATNTRSDKGIVGVLSGYPVLPGMSIIKYPQKSKSLNFLPKKLAENGYSDLTYIYGGDINFANMNSYVVMSGFDKRISKADFPTEFNNKKWGVHDEYTFNYLLEDISNSAHPTFKTFFTLSSHEPFDVPMSRVFKDDYINSVHYTDKCLGNFIKVAKTKPWWNNTLFILISDHGTTWKNLNNTNSLRYHIPMLWAGGALAYSDTVIDKIGSQTDLSVTLLKQLNIECSTFKFSKNLLNPHQKDFAFFNHNDGFFFMDKNQKQYYDIIYNDFYTFSGIKTKSDSLVAKAYIQTLYEDYIKK